MPRDPRNSYAGAYFHIGTRGNRKGRIYEDATDRIVFLRIVERCVAKYEWVVYAWCLMTTHYHFVIGVPKDGLSAGMRELNGGFARWSNQRHERVDHLFGRRFFSVEQIREAQLLNTCRYVILNPVRAGLCEHPGEWRWSSYRASVGDEPPPAFFARDELLRHVHAILGARPDQAGRMFRRYVEAGLVQTGQVPVPGTGTRV
jgi:putative transposase